MVIKSPLLDQFYRDSIAAEHFSYPEALAIFEELFREARALGCISSENILDGIEVNICVARLVNQLRHV